MHPLYGALPEPNVPVRITRGAVIVIFMRLLAAEPCSTAGLLVPCQYLSGRILVAPYLMVWNWWVSREGPMIF